VTGTGGMLLAGAALSDGRRVDVRVAGGRIAEVTPLTRVPAPPVERVDLDGWLLLPAPVEPHAHLDKALTADRVDNPAGDLAGAVDAWLRHQSELTHDDLVRRATDAAHLYLVHGATAVRSHVDVADPVGLRALAALRQVRDALGGQCPLQLVAFVGAPVTGAAGAGHRALLRDALAAGADVVGGCPALDPDPYGCVDHLLAVAAEHRRPVDLHVDETLDPAARSLSLLADAVGEGYPYGVAAGHCVSLAAQPVEVARRTADRLAAAGVAVICLPQTNLYLQGRERVVPGPAGRPRGLAPLDLLRDAGVTVAAGGDNLQDPFHPLGHGDPLETAALLVTAGHQSPRQAYDAVSTAARTVLGLPPVALAEGSPADLLAVRATGLRAALAGAATVDRMVFRAGRKAARITVTHQVVGAGRPANAGGTR
jgi:cytosine deaminase